MMFDVVRDDAESRDRVKYFFMFLRAFLIKSGLEKN